MSVVTITSSTCCRWRLKRFCSSIRPSGGSAVRFASNAKRAAMRWRYARRASHWCLLRRWRAGQNGSGLRPCPPALWDGAGARGRVHYWIACAASCFLIIVRPLPTSQFGLFGLLLIGALLLGGLWRGTSAVVALAAEVLSPAERMRELARTQEEFAPVEAESRGGKFTLVGTLRTFDGRPVPKDLWGNAIVRGKNSNICSTIGEIESPFSLSIAAGAAWLYIEAGEYAPVIRGPLFRQG